jgi:hypothetical protein
MDIQPQAQQPISDDQELAKVLAGVNQQANAVAAEPKAEEQIVPTPEQPPESVAPPAEAVPDEPEVAAQPAPELPPTPAVPAAAGDLESIKKDALSELRPLVDKLDVSPEEKFDTYLLLLRSTDDRALIAPAYEAARSIADEARRAQALLDTIKEIDYLSNPSQQPS